MAGSSLTQKRRQDGKAKTFGRDYAGSNYQSSPEQGLSQAQALVGRLDFAQRNKRERPGE